MIREVLDLRRLCALAPEEAAAVLAARRLDGASSHDEQALQAWLDLDDAHPAAWEAAQRAVDVFDDAADDEILIAMRQAALEAKPPERRWSRLAAAAAVFMLLAGGAFALFAYQGVPRPSGVVVAQSDVQPPSGAPDYQTRKGERNTFVLPDGSRATLDTDSAVVIAFTADRRSLQLLKGRAFFDVKHDASRPFAVRAGAREVVALGTRFDVRLDPGRLQVVLVEGRVSVAPANGASAPLMLRAGERLVDQAGAPVSVSAANVEEVLNWQQGFVTFRDDTLSAAAAELNRYTGDRLVVRDPSIARLRVTGVFRAGDSARFGRTLAQIHPVRVVRRGADELEIVPAS